MLSEQTQQVAASMRYCIFILANAHSYKPMQLQAVGEKQSVTKKVVLLSFELILIQLSIRSLYGLQL